MTRFVNLVLFLVAAALAAACGSSAAGTPSAEGAAPAATPLVSTTDGKELFLTYCAKCHGASGMGNGPSVGSLRIEGPMNLANVADKSDEELYVIISGGRGLDMAPFELLFTPEQRRAVIAYIRTLDQ